MINSATSLSLSRLRLNCGLMIVEVVVRERESWSVDLKQSLDESRSVGLLDFSRTWRLKKGG